MDSAAGLGVSDSSHFGADNFEEENLHVIKHELNKEFVKLWLPPYSSQDGASRVKLQELATEYAQRLNLPVETVFLCLEKLRSHALQKLKANEFFKSTGMASLHVHASWVTGGVTCVKDFDVLLPLQSACSLLRARIVEELEMIVPVEDMQLICKGRILKMDEQLIGQKVANTSRIMAVLLTADEARRRLSAGKEDVIMNRVAQCKELAEALSTREDGGFGGHDRFFLEINDQSGKKVDLPDEERKALAFAMTLHEKGRVLLKKREFSESLLLLLEADAQFRSCRSEILSVVDNYAVLCLDIVWCYFSMRKLEYLPDAESRLETSKACFSRSYGPNMERLNLMKGSDANELALFVRLHILEGICLCHQSRFEEAAMALNKAEAGVKRLQIDDAKFSQVVSMGFSQSEARLALRACRNDVTLAVEYIGRRREEKQQREEREKRERKTKRLAKKHGKTTSGKLLDLDLLEQLCEMGFPKHLSVSALRHADNDLNQALEVLGSNPGLLFDDDYRPAPSAELILQFTAMGFDETLVRQALTDCSNDPDKCLSRLVAVGQGASIFEANASSVADAAGASDAADSDPAEDDDELDRKVADAFLDLRQEDEDDYLDLTLEEETELINKYRLYITATR